MSKTLVPTKADSWDVSNDCTVEIKSAPGKRVVTLTYSCGQSPLPPCVPPPPIPSGALNAKEKKVYVMVDPNNKLTILMDVIF